jgi:hypothetical protein
VEVAAPRPQQPQYPAAVVAAGHPVAGFTLWWRLPAGRWRALTGQVRADWDELIDPVIHFAGVPNG